MTVLAHGVGTRADLPLPVALVVIGGGLAVLISFLALGALWREPRFHGPRAGRPLSRRLATVLDDPRLVWTLRGITFVLFLVVTIAAFAGPDDVPSNVAPWAFYVTFWVGIVPASLLFGPVWGVLNPLRVVHAALRPFVGPGQYAHLLPRFGYWPGALSLLAFVWLELASPNRSEPSHVGAFIVAHSLLQVAAACAFGSGWFAQGDGFEVYSRLLGRLSAFGRRDDGVLVVRNPLQGSDSTPQRPGLVAFVVVLVGSTAFDGLTRTQWWQTGPGSAGETDVTPLVIGLALTIAAVGAAYLIACWLSGRLGGFGGAARQFAHSLMPIAAGYAIAHYFSLFVFDGQTTWILASDPFGRGWDLFGTAGGLVDYTVVSTRTISLVQVGAIVLGHVIAVVLAHDRALRLAEAAPAGGHPVQSQVPLLVLMVALTVGALAILLGG